MMHAWLQDFRYAARMLRKNVALTAVMVASLAIGIGANSAIFSVVDALLLRSLPYPQPERLANVWLHSPALGIFRDWPSPGQYIDIQNENHSFEQMALAQSRTHSLTGREQPERINGLRAQSTLLQMFGAKPLLGRLFLPEEDRPGKAAAVILSERVWRRLFNSDPGIVGQSITLDGKPFIVAGVLQRGFMLNSEVMPSEEPMDKLDVFLPLPLAADAAQSRHDENYNIVVRLKPGVSIRQAQADIDMIASRIREKDKRDATFGMYVVGLQEQVVGDVRRALLVLLGSVTRQLLIESILLALLGGAAGLMVASASLSVIRAMNPGNIPRLEDITISRTVLFFTFGVSLVTGILFGLAPVWRAIKVDLNTSLKAGGRSGQSEGGLRLSRHRLRGILVVSELTLSLMLLIGAGLLVRSFVRLQNVPPGFSTEGVLTMQVAANDPKYKDEKVLSNFHREIGKRVANLPGVKAEGVVSVLPLTGSVGWGGINVEGYTPPPGQELQVDLRIASAYYFRTMEIPLIRGRFFTERDNPDMPQAAIINEKFAQRFWPNDDPIGKHLWFDPKRS